MSDKVMCRYKGIVPFYERNMKTLAIQPNTECVVLNVASNADGDVYVVITHTETPSIHLHIPYNVFVDLFEYIEKIN